MKINLRPLPSSRKLLAGLLLTTAVSIQISSPARAEDVQSQTEWQHYPVPAKAPANAPNILIVMTDDVGFGSASTFGGLIPTPNLDALAEDGLKYTQFHTTAMCSPTRAALLTGRNHHSVNSGAIGNVSIDREGYTSVIPKSAATIGKVLGMNGYHTAWIGKNHNTPLWEDTPVGPFDRWPNGLGFDYFYGFNGSQTNQFKPSLIENRNYIEVPDGPDYIFEKDMADRAIGWLRMQESIGGDAPFMLYYAPGTAHAPLQAPKTWLEHFRGKFNMGWDKMRQQICQRQIASGTIPAGTICTPRPAQIPAWSSLKPKEQHFSARLMEAYAAMLAYSDDQFGRIVAELKRSGRYENTLIIFIEGDNGASSESLFGELNETAMFNQVDTHAEDLENLDAIGSENSAPVNAGGWAWAMNAPFQWSKQIASHFGGTRNGVVISWPKRITDAGEVRTQFQHVIDIAPTLYEAVGITPPHTVDGVKQQRFDGISMVSSFDNTAAPQKARIQYFEILGNRAIYKDGWVAATTPRRMPWSITYIQPDYDWELYHVETDFSQAFNLASKEPERLAAMKEEFHKIASVNNVLPIDDSFLPRFSPKLRPNAFENSDHFIFYPSKTAYSPTSFPTLNSDWRISASVLIKERASGPVMVRGNKFSGWGLYLEEGRVELLYRLSHLDRDLIKVSPDMILNAGKHNLTVSVKRQPGGKHLLSLEIDGNVVGNHELSKLAFGRVETSIGRQSNLPIFPKEFSGKSLVQVEQVTVKHMTDKHEK